MTEKQKSNEKANIAYNYLVNFYNTVQQISHHYSTYATLIDIKKAQEQAGNVEEVTLQSIKNTMENVRYQIYNAETQYNAMKDKIKSNIVLDHAKKLNKGYIIDIEDLKSIVTDYNRIIFESVITEILDNAQDYLNEIYN